MMANDKIKLVRGHAFAKLINKDALGLVNYVESDLCLTPTNCSLFSEDGFEIPIHKEVLYQTKFMREIVNSMDYCCCKVLDLLVML